MQERRSDARRNAGSILMAGAQVLAVDPRASMQEIADAAGVHRATVHRHFPSRDDLVTAVRVMVLDDFLDLLARHAASDGPPRLRLEELTRSSLEHGDRYRLHRLGATFDSLTDERADAFRLNLAAVIGAAHEAGEVRRDVSVENLIAAWGGLIVIALSRITMGDIGIDAATEFVLVMLSSDATGAQGSGGAEPALSAGSALGRA